jgi:hypothetical protein
MRNQLMHSIRRLSATLLLTIVFASQLQAYEFPKKLATSTDSSVSFWRTEQYRPDYYFEYSTDTGLVHIDFIIYGYDMDSVELSTRQIDGMGLLEIILSYSMRGGGVDYCEEDDERWHCYRIFNPDSKTEIFNAKDRNYDFHADNGCGPTKAFSSTCQWSYDLRIDEKGWIHITNVTTAKDCQVADKKNGVYTFEFGQYRWHEH